MRNKQQLTITLPPTSLELVDAMIDGELIRNRSQAIEALISQGYIKTVETAVILAGSADTDGASQLLTKVRGRYLLTIMIDQLKQHGFNTIIICSGSATGSIKELFGDGDNLGIHLIYIKEKKLLGNAGALLGAKSSILGNNFLVMYGDILTNMHFKNFVDFYFAEGDIATMGIKPRMGEKKYGQVLIQGNAVVGYSAKETNESLGLVNTGIYLFSKKIFSYISSKKQTDIDKNLIPTLIKYGELNAFVFQGVWYDISAKTDLLEAESRWK